MKILRVKAYLFDFMILLLAIFIIGFLFPKTEYQETLQKEQDVILEDYLSHRITFQEYVTNYGSLYYETSKEGQTSYLCYLVFMLGYFVLLPFFWNGRTIGCYLCNLEVERFDQGRLHPWQLLVRYSFTFGLGYVLLNNICITCIL